MPDCSTAPTIHKFNFLKSMLTFCEFSVGPIVILFIPNSVSFSTKNLILVLSWSLDMNIFNSVVLSLASVSKMMICEFSILPKEMIPLPLVTFT